MAQPVELEPHGGWVRITAYPVASPGTRSWFFVLGFNPRRSSRENYKDRCEVVTSSGLSQEALEERYLAAM
jgi:hypothetical protein